MSQAVAGSALLVSTQAGNTDQGRLSQEAGLATLECLIRSLADYRQGMLVHRALLVWRIYRRRQAALHSR